MPDRQTYVLLGVGATLKMKRFFFNLQPPPASLAPGAHTELLRNDCGKSVHLFYQNIFIYNYILNISLNVLDINIKIKV